MGKKERRKRVNKNEGKKRGRRKIMEVGCDVVYGLVFFCLSVLMRVHIKLLWFFLFENEKKRWVT